jgi:mannose-1-phosphate guanylyltransferase
MRSFEMDNSTRTATQDQQRWGIILAGGEGTRLSSLTRRLAGDGRPKQFCSLFGDSTLLEKTRSRVTLGIADDQIMTVVTRAHELYYASLLRDMRRHNLVIQPGNRGTAVGILYALFRLARLTPAASVALFPSDHFISDDREFMSDVDLAFKVVTVRPELTVILGIAADSPEPEYGWIEPGAPIGTDSAAVFEVRQFWEKPSIELAKQLLDRGCLWNSFVMVAPLSTLLGLILVAAPDLYRLFTHISSNLLTNSEERSIERLYASISNADFSHDVLARHPANLAVLPVHGCDWSDLGEPKRVLDLWSRQNIQPRLSVA